MHTLFLLNPTAGKTDCTQQLPQQINAAAARAGLAPEEYTIRITTHAGHARELARAAAAGAQQAGEPLRIFTAGGDGTFNEALTGAYGFAGTAVGCLPYGSGNDFLRTFGTREEFLDLDAQLAGGAVPIDLMQTNLGLSATICAAGLDAQVAYGIPKFRRIPLCGGEVSYLLSIVEQLCGHIGRRVEYTIDGETFAVDCLMCAICNGRTYGGGFCAGPEAQPDDGWLDVFIVRKVGRLTIAKLTEPTDITNEIYKLCRSLFDELWDKHTPLRLLGIGLLNVTKEEYAQQCMFCDEGKDRARKLDRAVDDIRGRFGADTIMRGSVMGSGANAGKKYKAHMENKREG